MTALQPNASRIGRTRLSRMFDSVAVVPETSHMFYLFLARVSRHDSTDLADHRITRGNDPILQYDHYCI